MKQFLKKLLLFEEYARTPDFTLTKPDASNVVGYDTSFKISGYIAKNEKYIKDRFRIPLNNDLVLRKLTLKGGRRAFCVFIDGMSDSTHIDLAIISPLLSFPLITDEAIYTSEEAVVTKLIAHSQATASDDIEEVVDEINFGSCAVFVDGISKAFIMDTRSWGHRSIDKPENEQSIYGPQEAFAEMLRNNSALIRKIVKTEKLICESLKVGNVSKTRGVLMYISDIANPNLVEEVRQRIKSIDMDYVISSEEVALMIEDQTYFLTPQIYQTERPDRAARALTEGRVVYMLSGSPRVLIFPTNALELTHSPSDSYIRVPYANMSRIIRIIAMLFSILLPGLYLAITLFHQEMIPTYLLYSISAARENVPFPSVLEMLIMDLAFEIIREAGIRMPGPIGSTLGIVGGLILGQAAVSAKIVSPLMIIIIALTGIGSFATSDYSLGWSFRILRIIFIMLGAFFGFYGIALGIFVYAVTIATQKSFGVPYLSPLPENGWRIILSGIFVEPIWKNEKRPYFVKSKKSKSQPRISRKWTKKQER